MVFDVLSIPISTFTSKFTFSVGELVIDQFRSILKPDIVEALVYTKDWLYGDKGNTIYFYIHLIFIIYYKTFAKFFMFKLIFWCRTHTVAIRWSHWRYRESGYQSEVQGWLLINW